MEDRELLAIVRANHARRRFNLRLEDLCLEVIARNDELFATNAGQSALMSNALVPPLKSRILAKLSEQVFGKPRHPATKHRVEMVKVLINPQLEEFDFAACGDKFGKVANQQVWKCLAEKAGPKLRCVQDVRIKSHTQKTRTLDWCLPYLTLMPKLEKLRLTTLSCTSGQLESLVKTAPNLTTLHLLLHNSFEEHEIEHVYGLKSLEELMVLSYDKKMPPLVPKLLRHMPQLKINCVRADELCNDSIFARHERGPEMRGPFNLEHISMAINPTEETKFCFSEIPNVKHLMLATTSRRAPVVDYGKVFPNLQTLHLRGHDLSFGIVPHHDLAVNGKYLTSLFLESKSPETRYHLSEIFIHCPNLISLTLKRLKHFFHHPPLPNVKNLPLKELNFICCEFYESETFCWVFERAPMLEKLVLNTLNMFDGRFLEDALKLLASGDICLTNLQTFEFSVYISKHFDHDKMQSVYTSNSAFVKSLLAASPNLRRVAVDLHERQMQEAGVETRSLDKIIDIINDTA